MESAPDGSTFANEDAHVVQLCDIRAVRASEIVCEQAVARLAGDIARDGVWTHPIAVCELTGLVMDGNHRLSAAKRLEFERLPVVRLSYLGGRVRVWDRGDGGRFDLSRLDRIVKEGTVLPYKTTRHEFEPALPVVAIRIELLRRLERRHE